MTNPIPRVIELGSGTYILTPLPNARWHVFHRGSGLQGSMLRDGTDGPSWLSYNDMMRLALVARFCHHQLDTAGYCRSCGMLVVEVA